MLIDLTDAEPFARNEFWPAMAWLRARDPVHWHGEPGGGGFWAVTLYHDIVDVYRDSDTFSSRFGMRLESNPEAVSAVTQRMLIVSDPPDHTRLKRVLVKAFSPNEIRDAEGLTRDVVSTLLAEAVDTGELDIVDVTRRIPTYVICSLMGVPRSEWDWLGRTMCAAFEGEDEPTRAGSHAEIFLFFSELLALRRRNPGADLISRIVHGEPLADEEIVVNCSGVLAGANETTRYSAAGAVLVLAENPEQWATMRATGPSVVPTATEEVLRWTTPGVHVLRTAVRPACIGGTPIAPGDRVTLWNVSANRDESVFPHADRFDVTRTPNRHLAFGGGRHLCLGARLARLELSIFLEELIRQVASIELAGEPEFNASNFTWGLQSLRVRLDPGGRAQRQGRRHQRYRHAYR